MAKARRLVKTVRAARKTVKPVRKASPKKAVVVRPVKKAAVVAKPSKAAPAPEPAKAQPAAAPPAAVRKPGFYEAVAIYERGVQALQRHDFSAAASFFRTVLERYPEERELLERARLYLRVCERETSRLQPAPKTPAEHVYAATVALNSGDHAGALDHLAKALNEDPESDHAHYIMAVALGMRGRMADAIQHLAQSIALNPDNRSLARQDPDLDILRSHERFRGALDAPPVQNRRKAKTR